MPTGYTVCQNMRLHTHLMNAGFLSPDSLKTDPYNTVAVFSALKFIHKEPGDICYVSKFLTNYHRGRTMVSCNQINLMAFPVMDHGNQIPEPFPAFFLILCNYRPIFHFASCDFKISLFGSLNPFLQSLFPLLLLGFFSHLIGSSEQYCIFLKTCP